MSITQIPFGKLPCGRDATLYILRNSKGFCASVSDFGATLVSILAPDRTGRLTDVLCGFESADVYARADGYLGATVGRFCNRIARGRFELDGAVYDSLYINDGGNHLHGGKVGFSHRLWSLDGMVDGEEPALTLRLRSPDGEEGYPGNLNVAVTFSVSADNALSVHYIAETDKATPINLTNHAYFNLGGFASGNVLDQVLWLDAESYLRGDAGLVPTGEVVPVAGTPFDFREMKEIGRDIEADDTQLRYAGGYDHNYALDKADGTMQLAARARGAKSGICMDVYTDCVGIQLYTGNFITPQTGKGGVQYGKRHAFCLETQYFPNAVNEKNFKSPVLKAGDTYCSKTKYCFGLEK